MPEEKKHRSKSRFYNAFLKGKSMYLLDINHIKKALRNVTRFKRATIALLAIMYYTGARPDEVLKLRGKDISRYKTTTAKYGTEEFIRIELQTSKRGVSRTVMLNMSSELVKEIYLYSTVMPPFAFLFYMYKNKYSRKKKYFNKKTGVLKINETTEISDKLRYHFKKWFDGVLPDNIPPYYLRHNRLTKLAIAGATVEQLRLFKGAKDQSSVMHYMHQSKKESESVARLNE